MTTERDVGAGLRSMFREQAATPTAGLSRALAEIQVTSQDRARRLPRLPEWRIDPMLSATRFVIGAVIVATVGAGLFTTIQPRSSDSLPVAAAASPTRSPEPEPSATAESTESPTEGPSQPSGVVADSGILDTPTGQLEWNHMRGADLPRLIGPGFYRQKDGKKVYGEGTRSLARMIGNDDLIEWHDGDIAFVPLDLVPLDLGPANGPAGIFVSRDGREWRTQSLPKRLEEGDNLVYVDGVSWLISTPHCCKFEAARPSRLWRSLDGETWSEVEAGTAGMPDPVGLDWRLDHQSAATTGVAVIVRSAKARFPLNRLTKTTCKGKEEIRKRAPGLYVARRLGSQPAPGNRCGSIWARLRFIETEQGLRVIDDRTGTRLGRIDGAEMADIDRFVDAGIGFGIDDGTQVIRIDDEGVETYAAPWAESGSGRRGLATIDGAIYAFLGYELDDSARDVWRTTDGRSWVQVERPDSPANLPRPADRPAGTELFELASGWVATEVVEPLRHGKPGDTAWIHLGGEWVSLDPLGFHCAQEEGSTRTSWSAIGDTIFIAAHPGCEPIGRNQAPDLWVISPAD